MKKILIVSNMYPSEEFPHYGVFVKNTEKILVDAGFVVDRSVMYKQRKILLKILTYLMFYLKTIFLIIFNKYDYVYIHFASLSSLPVLIARSLTAFKIVVNVHGNDLVPETSKDKKYAGIVKKVLEVSETVVSPSRYFSDILIKDFGIIEKKIVTFPSGGVDDSIFFPINREKLMEKMNLDKSKFYLGFISRLEVNKGWDIFLKASKKILNDDIHNKTEIIVVGDGSEKEKFFSLVDKLGLRDKVHYYPLLSQKEVNSIMNGIDIFCFPTNRKSESLGLIGLEAMATRTMVVANNSYGPSSYMVHNENGICFSKNDPNELYDAINIALKLDSQKREKILDEAFRTSQKFSISSLKEVLINIFK
ncbi:glycosyltransferase family 4 protein [Enterococcus xiangfangensis]|uniref:Glycosyltransferase family 4 protein n=1 Tax=Enterococcus xiangfangensis TaxID=1296537 RepID=A0ABU3F7L3_9ENTE|nr:glycosyltransferase family 4 protein [Enterococcus xiangfangensis]MDT2758655.1 glycosyltransferase family 4 protein [Enterococcus xiangfangensis]NBK08311.1 glycosyltransferase [Enterococcus asini]